MHWYLTRNVARAQRDELIRQADRARLHAPRLRRRRGNA